MDAEEQMATMKQLMAGFAERTGLVSSGRKPVRYLWTDAFAVCNFLELFIKTGDATFKDLALRLVDQVHHILGRHRADDSRRGWISGLDERQGEKHPTAGGLRIGKELQERGVRETFDQVLEWEKDGQYYHYLTKWMHALNQTSMVTGDPRFHDWAVELGRIAHSRFAYSPAEGGRKRMFWKMSIDLSRPQVASMGQHDPLDGLVTYLALRRSSPSYQQKLPSLLSTEIDELAAICRDAYWTTDDPLGLGGLLCDAYQLARILPVTRAAVPPDLLVDILRATLDGLSAYSFSRALSTGPEYRLAFRELGLAIGLAAVRDLDGLRSQASPPLAKGALLLATIDRLLSFVSLREEINRFWLMPANQQVSTWLEHREINSVMLATSLAPDCFLSRSEEPRPPPC